MNVWWDKVDKQLYIGTKKGQANQFAIMFGNWFWFSKRYTTLRQWALFQIIWDNGIWWGDLWANKDTITKEIPISKMSGKYIEKDNYISRTGLLNCFIQITVLGIGFRYCYDKKATIITKNYKDNAH